MGAIIIIIIIEDSTNSVTAVRIIIGHVSLGEEGTQRKQYGMELGAFTVFSLSFRSAGNGQFVTGIFSNNLYSFSEPSKGCRR